jgi:hypothetical protein
VLVEVSVEVSVWVFVSVFVCVSVEVSVLLPPITISFSSALPSRPFSSFPIKVIVTSPDIDGEE